MTIDEALKHYGAMDNLGQAGVNIRIAAVTKIYPAENDIIVKAVCDELDGLPLP